VLIGCGLRGRSGGARRSNTSSSVMAAGWIVDLIGKGGRVRTVPVPAWVKSASLLERSGGHRLGRCSGPSTRRTHYGRWLTDKPSSNLSPPLEGGGLTEIAPTTA